MVDIEYEINTQTGEFGFTPLTGIAREWFSTMLGKGAQYGQSYVMAQEMLLRILRSGFVVHSEEYTAFVRNYFNITDADISLQMNGCHTVRITLAPDIPIVDPVIDEADTLYLRSMGVVWA